jgi:hypothetical protein
VWLRRSCSALSAVRRLRSCGSAPLWALQRLATASYVPYLLGLTAAGLLCYGVFCLVDARYRDVSTTPSHS